MIGFIKNALFAKTLSAIQVEQERLVRVSIELNELDSALKLDRKKIESERTSLDQMHKLLSEQKEVNTVHRNDLILESNRLNAVKEHLNRQKEKFEVEKTEFDKYLAEQSEIIDTKILELQEIEEELISNSSIVDEKLIELEKEIELYKAKKQQKQELKVINHKVINVRGKDVIIDKYGNFKRFSK